MSPDDDRLIEELAALEAKATPFDEIEVDRYKHGGARLFEALNIGGGTALIADFFDEANRECWIAARRALPRLLALLRKQRSRVQELETALEPFSRITPLGIAGTETLCDVPPTQAFVRARQVLREGA